MPAAGAPKAFHFPQAATKTLPNGLRVFVVTDHERAVDRRAAGDSHRGQHQGPRRNARRGADDRKHADAGHARSGPREKLPKRSISSGVAGGVCRQGFDDGHTQRREEGSGYRARLDVGRGAASRVSSATSSIGSGSNLLSNLTVQYSDPEFLASVVFGRVVYGNSPYGWPQEGTPETVRSSRAKTWRNSTTRNYAPNQSLARVCGRHHAGRGFRRGRKIFRGMAEAADSGDVASAPPQPAAISGPAHLADRQAGRGADANSRGQAGDPPQRSRLYSGAR